MPKASLRIQASIWKQPQDWPFEPSGYCFLPHAAQLLHPDASGDLQQMAAPIMRRKLADGELKAAALLSDGALAAIPSNAWAVDENFIAWFPSGQISNVELFRFHGRSFHPLAAVRHHWVFIEKAGMDANLGSPEAQVEQPGFTETDRPVSYQRHTDLDVIQRQPFFFLGQAIEWAISRGQPVESSHVAERWDEAERELFDFLDTENAKVEAYPVDGRPKVYEALPAGIWAKMNQGDDAGLVFSPLDAAEQREDGGTVCVGERRWSGARLATNVVLAQWPAAEAAPLKPVQTTPQAPTRRPASDATIKRAIVSCKAFADERGLVPLSRNEFVPIIKSIYPGTTREKIRQVFKDGGIIALLPPRSGPQGARNPNRNNELDEFSGFLSAAKLQN